MVLAAGRGTRMQRPAPGLQLDPEQERLASQGLKALIPFHGHPFLSYTLSALADAGIREVCLVVRPGDDPIRAYYERLSTIRLRLTFAVQPEPLGSANALLAAEDFTTGHFAAGQEPSVAERFTTEPETVADERFAAGQKSSVAEDSESGRVAAGCLTAVPGAPAPPAPSVIVLNGDNYYAATTLERLCQAPGNALAGFDPDALVAHGNIPAERIAAFALVTSHDDGTLAEIVEKPDPARRRELAGRALVSMTCWRFGPEIFAACRAIAPSVRGEYELPDAVAYAAAHLGARFQVLPAAEPVLDLSRREDIATVSEHLRGREVAL